MDTILNLESMDPPRVKVLESKKKLQVRIKGLEPLRASSLESKPSMSTNSIISARQSIKKKKNKNANKKLR